MEVNIQTLVTKTAGGNGGSPFTQRGIRTIGIRSGAYVDAIIINGTKFGGSGGSASEVINLAEDEFITRMDIRQGKYIDNLVIVTNKGQILKGGGDGGNLTTVTGQIIALGGRSGSYVDHLSILGNFE